jgi:hypothetical protein
VITAHDRKDPSGMWEIAFLNLLDPSSEHTDRDIVFGFAGGGTGMAANTFSVVNNKTVFHKSWMLYFKFLGTNYLPNNSITF